ncbi:MAG: HEAT repeat domain-containing protein [Acidobacteriaceae bacterium]|nr:HEAT repeat domain-containing protein [Acidobacteriaceae bacterium]
MKGLLLFASAAVTLLAGDSRVDRMLDSKATTAQRADACFELRGRSEPEVREAMSRALHLTFLRACAAENLRRAGAIEDLKTAAEDPDPEIQAAALPALGSFRKTDLLPLLASKAADPNLLVATNALRGLTFYDAAVVTPALEPLASKGGIVGIQALNLLASFKARSAVTIARALLQSGDIPDKVSAMGVLGEQGDASDLPALRGIAASKQQVAVRQRGFGLMPPIDLSQAARNTIREIQNRTAAERPGA